MLKKFVYTTALLAALPSSAPAAALDYYLKIDGIQGESTNDKHKNEIDVLSWAWGTSRANDTTVFAPFSWQQGLDRSFVPLFLGLTNGTSFASALLSVVRPGVKAGAEFFQMKFEDAEMVSLSSKADTTGIVVDAAMTYGSITMTYRMQKADGTLDSPIVGTWTKVNHALTFTGDPLVMRGLAEAGGSLDFVSTVPEPSSWVSLVAGLGIVGAVLRRRRKADSSARASPAPAATGV